LLEADMIEELQEEANECAAAKQELVDADTDEAVDRAVRKVQLLCYDQVLSEKAIHCIQSGYPRILGVHPLAR